MSFFHKNSGNISISLIAATVLTVVAGYMGAEMLNRQKLAKNAATKTLYPVQNTSAAEAALLVIRAAERTYYRKVRSLYKTASNSGPCSGPARSFVRALTHGIECLGVNGAPVTSGLDTELLTQADWASSSGKPEFLTYLNKCTFRAKGKADCGVDGRPLFRVGADPKWKTVFGGVHTFSIESLDDRAGLLAMRVEVENEGQKNNYRIGFRWDSGNLIHLEPSGRITQELPNSASICGIDQRPGRKGQALTPWAPYYALDPKTGKCTELTQTGSTKALAYYLGNYFGLRSIDGQIMRFLPQGEESKPFLVNETGQIESGSTKTGDSVEFKYSKEALRYTDDITIIDGHLFYVAGQGHQAHIGYLLPGECPSDLKNKRQFKGWCRINVCDLGAQGFSMRYKGLAAPSWVQSLFTLENGAMEPKDGAQRSTTFLLKTSSGSLLRAVAWNNPGATNNYSECAIVMDREEQSVEYKRTFGFDRSASERMYYIF